jgi:hypothetical protein
MIDPVAAFDQLDAIFKQHAIMCAQYYHRLREQKVPPMLARDMTKEMHRATMGLLNHKGT